MSLCEKTGIISNWDVQLLVFLCVSADMEVTEAEEQVEKLLSGQGLEVNGCDVGLEQSKPATLRKNVTYIVCAVIFNDKVQLPLFFCALH